MSAERTAEQVQDSTAVEGLARLGLASRGVVWLVVGLLAASVALGRAEERTDRTGALAAIKDKPLGGALLVVLVVGFLGYAAYRLLEAGVGHRDEDGAKRWGARLVSLATGVFYGILAVSTAQFLLRGSGGGDRCGLGRQTVWPPGRFSTLAGCVEPGESAEQAVVREVAEETGVACWGVEYVDSQPWPFPASLMLGFTARCDPGATPRPADGELAEARWFSRAELRGAATWGAATDAVQLPSPVSIAHLLITRWVGQSPPG